MGYEEDLERELLGVRVTPADLSVRERLLASADKLAAKHNVSRERALEAILDATPALRRYL
jgi:hypothetical protein